MKKPVSRALPRASFSDFGNQHADELSALLAVASERSFVAAGGILGRDPTIVSKRIAALEQRLGVRLVERSTRQVRLTDAGLLFVERIQASRALLRDAEQEVTAGAAALRGRLRIALPAALGRMWIAPAIHEFLAQHPLLELDIEYSERYTDLIGEGFDAALRVGILSDSRLVARRLAGHRRILAAAPAYLERHGMPAVPDDLAHHNCLEFTRLEHGPEWSLTDGSHTHVVQTHGNLRSNDGQALLMAALDGVGIVGAGEWLLIQQITAGRLVRVLPHWSFDTDGAIYVLRPSARHTPVRTEAFVAWISTLFQSDPPWQTRP